MTNKEFYGDKLLTVALQNACGTFHRVVYGKNCGGKSCEDCEFSTVENIENWLNAEHEELLLENGDELKPGNWIMVRDEDGDAWRTRQFMCFYEGYFFAALDGDAILDGDEYSGWKQARLPMEGE